MSAPDAMTSVFDQVLKIGGLCSFIGLVVTWVWVMSRRWQSVERGNQAWLQLNGDKDSKNADERTGLIAQYESDRKHDTQWRSQLQDAVSENTSRVRGLQDGIGAHGSRSDIIAQNARKSIAAMTTEELQKREDAEVRRKQIVAYQHQAFAEERDRDSFPEAPALPPRPDPKPFNPDDTGRWKGRKR